MSLRRTKTDSHRDEQSVGGAIFQTSIQIGASLGTCLASLISTTRAEATGDLLRGLKDGFWILTAFAWLGKFLSTRDHKLRCVSDTVSVVLIVVFIGLRKVGLARDVRGPRGGKEASAGPH